MTTWSSIKRFDSKDTSVTKYVFESVDAVAEAVLYGYPTHQERTVVCCSTQSGCPVGCRFCGAGDSFVRSLTTEEIVSQPWHLFDDRGIDPNQVQSLQIMFMSMGEPLLNQQALLPALEMLHESIPSAALLISTSGPSVDYRPLRKISVEIPRIGLQFSVHESTDEARNALIPFQSKLTLEEIALQGELWYIATNRRPFFNYCAHERNTSIEDADRLRRLFDPAIWEATISVVCERDESIAAANARQRELASRFQQLLRQRDYSTRMFDPAGQDDIGGGCGQLFHTQRWMETHPTLAKPSVGKHLPVIHAPRGGCGL